MNEDVSVTKLLINRTTNPKALDILTQAYTGKNVQNFKKMRLKVDVFSLQTGVFVWLQGIRSNL